MPTLFSADNCIRLGDTLLALFLEHRRPILALHRSLNCHLRRCFTLAATQKQYHTHKKKSVFHAEIFGYRLYFR